MAISQEQFRLIRNRFDRKRDETDQYYRSNWKDIADYLDPYHGRFLDKDFTPAEGGNKSTKIINPKAVKASRVAVAGMVGGLIPHSLPWFRLGPEDPDLAQWGPAKEWFADVQQRMYNVFSRSNFYAAGHSVFREEVNFGTGPMMIREHPSKVIHCRPWTVGEYVLMVDQFQLVDTGFRWFWSTARQLAQQFGKSNLTPETTALLDKNPDTFVEVVCGVMPREDADPSKKDSANMPYASIYWERKASSERPPLGESGFNTNPMVYPRWDTIGEDAYGVTCPGIDSLGDLKMLQKLERDALRAVELSVAPPVIKPEGSGRLSILPNAVNEMASGSIEQVKNVFQRNPEVAPIENKIQNVELRIQEGFFNDLFLMILNDKRMTATEVAQRHEDKLKILGPVIEKQNSEFLSPLIDRVYDIMERRGLIPPPPEELQGEEIKVEYISLLAQAQRMVGTQGIEQVAAFVGSVAKLQPDVLDKVDFDVMVEEYADARGVSPKVINPQDEVDQVRAVRQQQQAAMQQQEAASMGADTAKTLSETEVGGENALDTVLGQMIPSQ